TVLQMLKLPDGTVKVLVEGNYRVQISEVHAGDYHSAIVSESQERAPSERESEILVRCLQSLFVQYVKLSKKVPSELLNSMSGISDPGRLTDTMAAHLELRLDGKPEPLGKAGVAERVESLMAKLE